MKEILTLQAVLSDLDRVATHRAYNRAPNFFGCAVSLALLAVIVCLFFESLMPLFLFLPGVACFTILFVREVRCNRAAKAALKGALKRENVSISVEEFSHMSEETIVEPHGNGRHAHMTKEVRFCYFTSGGSWRVPTGDRLYSWSKTHNLSIQGLENISLQGDAFFYVSLQGYPDICYAYPCKFFTLDEVLRASHPQSTIE